MNSMSIIGAPIDRIDGPAKVTGSATYAHETPSENAAHAFIVEGNEGPGKITRLDTSAAEAADGVLAVITHENAPDQLGFGKKAGDGRFAASKALMESARTRFHGDPIALVVAETFEEARAAAHLVSYEVACDDTDYQIEKSKGETPAQLDGGLEPDSDKGDFDTAFADAEIKVDATYTTPLQHHGAMEPHAALAEIKDGKVTVHMAIQIVADAVKAIARTFKLEEDDVRIVSPYIGGGFGGKLGTQNDAILAVMAAMHIERPVRLAMTRRQVFASAPHRANSIQRLRLGASRDGVLSAVGHEAWLSCAEHYEFAGPAASPTRAAYATPNMMTRHRITRMKLPESDSMRAPGEAIGSLTLECAMDELAHELGLDPLALRLANEPEINPEDGLPFASRDLAECLKEGAEKFGWSDRPQKPRARREGRKLIGFGMASAIRPNILKEASARVRMGANGNVTASLDMTDIGTGTYTILAQIAADTLDIDISRVTVELGDSDYPQTAGSGGSFGAASSGSALYDACATLKQQLDDIGGLPGPDGLEALGSVQPGEDHDNYAQYSYGAQFAEVEVDMDSCEPRLRRMLGVFSAGRILNRKTARSQLLGGMVFGVGSALMEEIQLDPRYGAFMNRDLAEYHLPVHGDVPDFEVHFREVPDMKSNPLGTKGIGELGICGAGAAIANAVFNATGVRIRDFPITLDKLVPEMIGS